MTGITRIEITGDFYHDRRTALGEAGRPLADAIYFDLMERMGAPLKPSVETVRCTKQQAIARYDHTEGIDVILTSQGGSRFTVQEKCLDPAPHWRPTLTIEEYKASGKPGAWFYCTAQWYFGAVFVHNSLTRFEDWMIVDLPGLRVAHETGRARGHRQKPRAPRRGGPFFYWYYREIPEDVIVARHRAPRLEATDG